MTPPPLQMVARIMTSIMASPLQILLLCLPLSQWWSHLSFNLKGFSLLPVVCSQSLKGFSLIQLGILVLQVFLTSASWASRSVTTLLPRGLRPLQIHALLTRAAARLGLFRIFRLGFISGIYVTLVGGAIMVMSLMGLLLFFGHDAPAPNQNVVLFFEHDPPAFERIGMEDYVMCNRILMLSDKQEEMQELNLDDHRVVQSSWKQ